MAVILLRFRIGRIEQWHCIPAACYWRERIGSFGENAFVESSNQLVRVARRQCLND